MFEQRPFFNFKPYSGLSAFNLQLLNIAFGPCWCAILCNSTGDKFLVRLYHPKYIWYFDSVLCSSVSEAETYVPSNSIHF